MASIKLNSNRHENKSFKIKRKNALNKAVESDKSGLKPASDLNTFGRSIFRAIKQENDQLSNSDNYLLNLLCSEYQLYIKMNDYIIKHGAVDDKGKKSAQFQILKTTIDQILKLSSQLNITPKNRISADFHAQSHTDPVKEVFR